MDSEYKSLVDVIGVRQLYNTLENRRSYFVLLREKDPELNIERYLPIFIEFDSYLAIEQGMEEIHSPRPRTHDLLSSIVEGLDAIVVAVEIIDMKEETYFAEIVIAPNISDDESSTQQNINHDDFIRISARPSDAIALAVRVKCPIYVEGRIMEENAFLNENSDFPLEAPADYFMEEIDEGIDTSTLLKDFQDFIKTVSPEDFEKSDFERGDLDKGDFERGDLDKGDFEKGD